MVFQETVFAQLMSLLDHNEFQRCVERYQGNVRVRTFSCQDQFLCMIFGQLAQKKSLRATVFSLRQMKHKLYHMGIRGHVSLNTLAHANASRDWRIWQDYAQSLIERARTLYEVEPVKVDEEIATAVYAFDSTQSLCACRFFPGRNSAAPRQGLNCIPN